MPEQEASTPTMLPAAIPLKPLIECYEADPHMTHQKWVQWACDCANRALPIFEAKYPTDKRPRQAIAASRRWVANPTEENAYTAADAAARAAARAAADAAADAAAAAARAAAYAARAAARAAAYAARAAASAAADAAADAASERLWQTVRLMEIYHEERP